MPLIVKPGSPPVQKVELELVLFDLYVTPLILNFNFGSCIQRVVAPPANPEAES